MNVSDIMTERPATVRLHSTLREVLDLMEQLSCHHMPVLSSENHLIGIISDRDCRLAMNSPYIMRERWQDQELVSHLFARMIMTPAPVVIAPEATAEDAARLMLSRHISCLPVMRDETLVGIITVSDILMAFVSMSERLSNRTS